MGKAAKRIRVRVTKVQVQLNDANGTLVDCEFEKPRRRQRQRHLSFVGVFSVPTRRQERHISKAVRAAIRAAERV